MSNAARKMDDHEQKPTERLGPDGRPLRINPKWVEWNYKGFVFGEAFVRLPDGCTAADLNEHRELFTMVQQDALVSLKRFDRVFVVAFDESWCADAIVSEASGTHVGLTGYKIVQLPERHGALPQTEDFAVVWGGNGYFVKRKSDGLKVSEMVPSLSVATQFMNSKYSRRG